jgi:hypothetical protein
VQQYKNFNQTFHRMYGGDAWNYQSSSHTIIQNNILINY